LGKRRDFASFFVCILGDKTARFPQNFVRAGVILAIDIFCVD
jgi:hypothetical protein